MVLYDWIFIGVIVVCALIGAGMGFGRALGFFTSGIFGTIICAIGAFVIGGMFNNLDTVTNFIKSLDDWFTQQLDFLRYLKLGTVCYYVIIFVALQIIRMVIVRVLRQVAEIPNPAIKVVNKVLGATFSAAFILGVTLVVLALFKRFDEVSFITSIVGKLENGFLHTLYENNIIKF